MKSILNLQVLSNACELELFDKLSSQGPCSADTLADKYSWDNGNLRRLLDCLVSLEYVSKNTENGKSKLSYLVGLKRVLGYSYSGRYQTSTRYCRPTRVLGIYNDRRKLCCKVACGDYFKAYTSRPPLSLTK